MVLSTADQLVVTRQNASQANMAAASNAPQTQTVIDGVRLEEVLEHACGALHNLARDPANRAEMVAHPVNNQYK